MSSRRLQSSLYHAVPKPASRPPPLWQVATALDPTGVPAASATRAPLTSAVLAGWICVGIGLLTAWFFPLAHVFFSIAIILSIVALATHQVRAGLVLLAGSLAGIAVCAILFVCGLAVIAAGSLHAATKPRPELSSRPPRVLAMHGVIPAVSTSRPVAQAGTLGGNPAPGVTVHPIALDEMLVLLSEGRRDDEIITATVGRPLLGQIGSPEVTSLRAYGASEELINDLRARPVSGNSRGAPTFPILQATAPSRVVVSAPAFPVTQLPTPSAPVPTPVDHAARDRQIADLQKRIDQLDETIRRVRADPHYYGITSGSTDTARQQSSDAYLGELDKQSNDLRRQKWALEGR